MSVAKLCEALVGAEPEHKVEIEVFTTTANGASELKIDTKNTVLVDGVTVKYFRRLTKDHTHFSPALLWSLRKEILSDRKQRIVNKEQGVTKNKKRKTKNDLIIHIHAWWNLVSVLSCVVAKWYKIPVLLSPRGMLTAYTLGNRNSVSKRLIHFLVGKSLLGYCHMHATSEKEKEDILAVIKPKSIAVIPNLVELEKVRSPSSEVPSREESSMSNEISAATNETFKLVFLSRIEEKKGLDLLFNALANTNVNWFLSIAGSGDETYVNSLKLKAESLALNNKISWLGQVDKKDKFGLLAKHDLLILTSYNENFANVVIESLSVGTPVLISKEVGLYDYVTNNDLGWITALNVDAIKQQLINAFEAKEKRGLIKSVAPQIIQADFNDKKLVESYLELYQKIY